VARPPLNEGIKRGNSPQSATFYLKRKKICQFFTFWQIWCNGTVFVTRVPNTKTLLRRKIKMATKIRPLHDRVVVEAAAAEAKTKSGIIIPDTAQEKPQRGKVIAVGPGKKDEPTTVKVGDAVLYGKYSGTEVTFDGKDYLIMRESDILAVL
jgi:chaperonin GroES